MSIQFNALPTDVVADIRETGIDAYGQPVERHVSDGSVWPCRHCLGTVPAGRTYLILAHRPFADVNPYAETGPIFLCADACTAHRPGPKVPKVLQSPEYLVRGYDAAERIVYGTGRVVLTAEIGGYAATLFEDPRIAFADVRSASNNCFQCRVTRAA